MPDSPYANALAKVVQELAETEAKAAQLRETRLTYMWECRRMGMSYAQIANIAGVTKAYVHQVVTRAVKDEIANEKREADES